MTTLVYNSGSGDCFWDNSGYFSNTDTVAVVGNDADAGDNPSHAYFPFPSVNVPNGTQLISATLGFYVTSARNGDTVTVRISCNDVDSSTPPTTRAGADALALTSAYTQTNLVNATGAFTKDITTAVQEVINRAGWAALNTIGVVIRDYNSSSGRDRLIATEENTTYSQPTLTIEYSGGVVELEVPIAANADDGYWYGGSGEFYPSATQAHLVWNSTYETNEHSFLRFDGIAIPNGAVIANAKITVVPTTLDGADADPHIYGVDEDDATAPTSCTDANGRTLTTATINPVLSGGVVGTAYEIVGLRDIVQEIVDREGWVSGNAICFLMKSDWSDYKLFYFATLENTSYAEAILTINYIAEASGGEPVATSPYMIF